MKKAFLISLIALFVPTFTFASSDDISKKAQVLCGACHGKEGISKNPLWPNLAGQEENYLFKQLKDFQLGKRFDPVMNRQVSRMTDDEMKAIAGYFAHLPLPKNKFDGETEVGKKIYEMEKSVEPIESCASCHGVKGEGILEKNAPAIAGQHAKYTIKQLKLYKHAGNLTDDEISKTKPSEFRNNDEDKLMQIHSKSLSDEEIEAVANYLQGMSSHE